METSKSSKNSMIVKNKRELFRNNIRKQAKEFQLSAKRALFLGDFKCFPPTSSTNIKDISAKLYHSFLVGNKDLILSNIRALRLLTCVENFSQIDEISSSEIIPHLITYMGANKKERNSDIFVEILWFLTNFVYYSAKGTITFLLKSELLLILKEILQNEEDPLIIEQALICCGNLATENEFSDCFFVGDFDKEAYKLIMKHGNEHYSKHFYRNMAFFLYNLAYNGGKHNISRMLPFLDVLFQLLYKEDEETARAATWCLFIIADNYMDSFKKIIDSGVLTKIIKNFLAPNLKLKYISLKFVSLISSGPDNLTEVLYQNSVFVYLGTVLDCFSAVLRKEALYCISNLVAEDKENHLQKFVESDIFGKIVKISMTDEFCVVIEAMHVLCNFVYTANAMLFQKFVEKAGYKTLIELFGKFIENNDNVLLTILNALDKILASFEGKDKDFLIEEFLELGGVEMLRKGKERGDFEELSRFCTEFYQRHLMRCE